MCHFCLLFFIKIQLSLNSILSISIYRAVFIVVCFMVFVVCSINAFSIISISWDKHQTIPAKTKNNKKTDDSSHMALSEAFLPSIINRINYNRIKFYVNYLAHQFYMNANFQFCVRHQCRTTTIEYIWSAVKKKYQQFIIISFHFTARLATIIFFYQLQSVV